VGGGVPNAGGCVPSEYQPQKCPILVNGEPVVPYPFQDTKVRPETYYYHPDHLGSTSWVTDQNGKVHEHVEYFPYGEVWREPKSDRDGAGVKGQRFLFSGKELDEETGLYYFGARYYDPVRVRWTSTDKLISLPFGDIDRSTGIQYPSRFGNPNGPASLNLYAFVQHNPLLYVDPTGNQTAERGPAEEEREEELRGEPPRDLGSTSRRMQWDAQSAELDKLEPNTSHGNVVAAPEWVPGQAQLDARWQRIQNLSRRAALDRAQDFAQVPRESRGGEPISFSELNPDSRGPNAAELQRQGARDAGRRDPRTGATVEDHPDGHPTLVGAGQPPHHAEPHVHGRDARGGEVIIPYRGPTRK
jgi:RHS repeat-associated protein